MDIWLGTSGYSYPGWVGDFYPTGTRPERMLSYYSKQFPLVELNYTFYRLPTAPMLANLADKTPDGFQFLVKLPQTISHEQGLHDLKPFREAVLQLHKREQLAGLLCQLPQSCHDTSGHRLWLRTLARGLGDLRLAVEFRHRSWSSAELPDWMEEQGLELVAVDVPDIPSLFPRRLVQAGPRVYVRMHSRRKDKWYDGDKERYDYEYSDEELGEWVDALAGADATDTALILFNNCYRGQAAVNARRMATLFNQRGLEFNVVQPFGEPALTQRMLFDAL
jgi:uncharacterized protein YecE (DUF72 family)